MNRLHSRMQAVISRVHKIVASPENAAPEQDAATFSPFDEDGQLQLLVHEDNDVALPATQNVAPAESNEVQRTLAPEYERIVDQLQFATLLNERKSAVTLLQDHLNQDQNQQNQVNLLQLGQRILPILLYALTSDPRDADLMETILEVVPQLIQLEPNLVCILLQPLIRPPESSATSFSDRLIAAAAAAAGDSTTSQASSWASSHLSSPSGIALLLELLKDSSSWIRGPALNILKIVQERQPEAFLTALLDCQEGLRKLLDMTQETREDIRYLVLQLLVKVTDGASFVQQFIAFEDGFHRFFSIITTELGILDDDEDDYRIVISPVVSDCLEIIRNVIRENGLTQKLLLQTQYLETVLPELLCPPSIGAMDTSPRVKKEYAQQKRAQLLALQILRFLVSDLYEGIPVSKLDEIQIREREKKHHVRATVQQEIAESSRLMAAISEVAVDNGWFEEERMGMECQLQALDLLVQITDNNDQLQLGIVHLYTLRSRESVVAGLLRLELQEEEDGVSAAATGFLETLFRENVNVRLGVLQHIHTIPPSVEPTQDCDKIQAPGRLLLDAMVASFGHNTEVDSIGKSDIVAWKAIHRFVALIQDNYDCKRLALRVTVEDSALANLFFTQCLRFISVESTHSDFRLQFAVLKLLILWSIECPDAVHEILCSAANLSILVNNVIGDWKLPQQLSVQLQSLSACLLGCCLEYTNGADMSRKELLTLLTRRIGLNAFSDCLARIRSSLYASKFAGPGSSGWDALDRWEASGREGVLLESALMDKAFASRIGGLLDCVVPRMLRVFLDPGEDKLSNENHVIQPYRELIRMQDKEIGQLKGKILEMERICGHRSDEDVKDGGEGSTRTMQTQGMIIEDLRSALLSQATFMQPRTDVAHPVGLKLPCKCSREDDLAVMVASLAIQCKAFAEYLKRTKGAEAVQNVLEVSRKRGADVNTFHILDEAYT